MDLNAKTDHAALCREVNTLTEKYPFITKSVLGKSIGGRDILLLCAGDAEAEKSVVYVGAHHAMEYITSALLLRFLWELGDTVQSGSRLFGTDIRRMLARRRIMVIPMLNPDGVELHLNGMWEGFPLAGRTEQMSGGDYSHWQANARGVDLNHNYDALFAEYKAIEAERGIEEGATLYSGVAPESEPETAAMCALLRYDPTVRTVLSLHTQGEVIYYGGNAAPTGSRSLGRTLARMTGYTLEEAEDTASYGGLTDWFVRELERPAFTLECGLGENPLPAEDAFGIYARLREALFCVPYLV